MSSWKITEKMHKYVRIALTEPKWILPPLAHSSAFYLTANAPATHVICNLKNDETAAIFIEIADENVEELKLDATLDDRSSLELVCFLKNLRSGRLEINIELTGERSAADVRNIVLSNKQDKNVLQTLQNHNGQHSRSSVRNIAILDGDSVLSFSGLIRIDPKAADTKSSQYTQAVLLSKSAHADVAPNLEIANKEVTCNHGASVGQLDPTEIYYMRSRGLDPAIVQNLLIKGCVLSAFDGLRDPFWKNISDNISENERFSATNIQVN